MGGKCGSARARLFFKSCCNNGRSVLVDSQSTGPRSDRLTTAARVWRAFLPEAGIGTSFCQVHPPSRPAFSRLPSVVALVALGDAKMTLGA